VLYYCHLNCIDEQKWDVEMTTGFYRETATIYQFPVGGRAAVGKLRGERYIQTQEPQPTTYVDFGSWYHDEAIREERDDGKPHS
jgi:hypothetical protein